MNIVCIIPARGGSKGLPSKNIKKFVDKPLLAWSVLQAKASSKVNAGVYVSSDSADILRVAEDYGANTILRPDNLSTDSASSEAALSHAMNSIIKEKKVDYVVFLQCTSPIRLANDIDDAIDTIVQNSSDSLLSVQALTDYFVWEKKGAVANSHNFDYTNRQRRQDLPTRYLENGSIYIFKPEVLIKNRNRLGGKISLYPMEKIASQQIDDIADFEFCEAIMRGMN